MTAWPAVRTALSEAVAGALGWPAVLATWETEPQQVDGDFARLSVVSSTDEGERKETIDPATLFTTVHEDTRAQVQVMIESVEGEKAVDLCETVRTHLRFPSLQGSLLDLGVALVQEPGPVRPASYRDEDGFWVSVASFEIPIRFRKDTIDPDNDPKRATQIGYSGEVDSVTTAGTVTKP